MRDTIGDREPAAHRESIADAWRRVGVKERRSNYRTGVAAAGFSALALTGVLLLWAILGAATPGAFATGAAPSSAGTAYAAAPLQQNLPAARTATVTATAPPSLPGGGAPLTPTRRPALRPSATAIATATLTATVAPARTSLLGRLPTPTPVPPTPTPTAPPQPTPDGVVREVSLPILMTPEQFAAQLDRLLAEGYTTVSFYQFLEYLTLGSPLPEKPVILTFDDGYRDNFVNAFPALKERGMVATFFVVTDFLDEERPAYLNWEMAREMLAAGMSIESHSRNHASLEGKDDDYLVWQALGSLETLQFELGVRPRFVSYPAGEYDQRTIAVFQSAGYWAGVTTIQGMDHVSARPFELERIRVRNTTDADELIRLMERVDW
jgi:peptidoglycan/xylan/chitin deacetylase (PgdA/CDA1 family)